MHYGVVIPARNEERNIKETILSLQHQFVKPYLIIVVDDSSVDKTPDIARSLDTIVIELKRKCQAPATGTSYMAYIINKGLEILEKEPIDYVMISGADCIYPRKYAAEIIHRMMIDDVVLASGVAEGEYTSSLSVRGAGRFINSNWFRSIGFRYPLNYGFETWLIYKALSQGYRVKVYRDLMFKLRRKTSMSSRKALLYGRAMKALGYTPFYALARIIRTCFIHSFNDAKYMLIGYLRWRGKSYDDIKDFVRYLQIRWLPLYIKRIFKAAPYKMLMHGSRSIS